MHQRFFRHVRIQNPNSPSIWLSVWRALSINIKTLVTKAWETLPDNSSVVRHQQLCHWNVCLCYGAIPPPHSIPYQVWTRKRDWRVLESHKFCRSALLRIQFLKLKPSQGMLGSLTHKPDWTSGTIQICYSSQKDHQSYPKTQKLHCYLMPQRIKTTCPHNDLNDAWLYTRLKKWPQSKCLWVKKLISKMQ